MKTENIKPPLFISKKIRIKTTMVNIKTNLKTNPPQRKIINIFSGLLILITINITPIIKFRVDSNIPKRIDLKSILVIIELKKRIERVIKVSVVNEMDIEKSRFSFFIFSGFQNRFYKCVHTSKYTKESKYNS